MVRGIMPVLEPVHLTSPSLKSFTIETTKICFQPPIDPLGLPIHFEWYVELGPLHHEKFSPKMVDKYFCLDITLMSKGIHESDQLYDENFINQPDHKRMTN